MKKIPPCSKCPYKLGLVETVFNPCPQCMLNNYSSFEQFQKQLNPAKKIKNKE
ncbi:MAG: hypothetical protein NC253_01785 [Ruminococcus sp.]|nr:hypothetical protein [Ruminococcus sp.]MCM1381204.1 hypothetical protein [Muribaculaceae bacterium]MCM1478726.1 hypothetical protein [Muribaculaceae bacterium]